VHHVYLPGETATPSDWESYLDGFANAWETRFLPNLTSNVSVRLVRGSLRQSSTDTLTLERARSNAGDRDEAAEAQNCCSVVSWLILTSHRGGRPRTYFPGVPVAATTGQALLTGAYAAAMASAGAGFIGDVSGLSETSIPDSILGCVHFQLDDAWLDPTTFSAFLGAHVRPYIRTQRRRIEP
jgi:hypothetical protein